MTYGYNQYGEKISELDSYGNSTAYEYDNNGRLVKVTDSENTSTKYTYDKAGNRTTMTDGRGKLTVYGYGDGGILTTSVNPNGYPTTFKYDLSLNLVKKVDENGNETTYAFDNMNNVTSRAVKGKLPEGRDISQSVTFSYDERGNRKEMQDSSGNSQYRYDENNKLLEIKKNDNREISYTYDEAGNISSMTDRDGFTTKYSYDKLNRMKGVTFTSSGRERTTQYSYDVNGNREAVIYDGGAREEYAYDKNNRLLTITNKGNGGEVISKYAYTYDLNGRQVSKTDSNGTTNYAYDTMGRIKKVEAPDKQAYYSYDKSGNRVSSEETYAQKQKSDYVDNRTKQPVEYGFKRSEYTYSNTNTLLMLVETMKDQSGNEVLKKTTRYLFDKNGNQIREASEYTYKYQPGTSESYGADVYGTGVVAVKGENTVSKVMETVKNSFDGFNRLVASELVRNGKRTICEYGYNGDDLRISKTVKASENNYAPKTINYIYDRTNVVLEYNGHGQTEVRYVRGINYIGRIDKYDALSYILYNGHGDVVQTVSENGTVENRYDYDVFGNPTLEQEKYSMDIRYAGYMYDAETGDYYLQSRYYDAYIGRFISEDSYKGSINDPLSLNLYTYCENDPIDGYDPDGHQMVAYVEGPGKNTQKPTVVTDKKTGKVTTYKVTSDFDSSKIEVTTYNSYQDYSYKKPKQMDTTEYTEGNGKKTLSDVSEKYHVNGTYNGDTTQIHSKTATTEKDKLTIVVQDKTITVGAANTDTKSISSNTVTTVITPTTKSEKEAFESTFYVHGKEKNHEYDSLTLTSYTDKPYISYSRFKEKNGEVLIDKSGKESKDVAEEFSKKEIKDLIRLCSDNGLVTKVMDLGKFYIDDASARVGNVNKYWVNTFIKQGYSRKDAKFIADVVTSVDGGELLGALLGSASKARGGSEVVGTGWGKFGSKFSEDAEGAGQASKNVGIVQSRINVANEPTRFSPSENAGLEHVIDRHFNPGKNAGQFTISVDELKSILSRKDIVKSPVSVLETSGQYSRTVNVGEVIGTVKPSLGGEKTTWMQIITDSKGNLITAYPIPKP